MGYLDGFKVTFNRLFDERVTGDYPNQKRPKPERFHGRHVLKREGNHQPGLWHPAGVYPCRDGHIMLVLSSSAHRDRFLVEAGIPEILADPRFANDLMLGQNKDAFDEALGPWLMDHTSDEIIAIRIAQSHDRDHADPNVGENIELTTLSLC